MSIDRIEAIPLTIPFKPGDRSDAAAWDETFGFRAVATTKVAIEPDADVIRTYAARPA